MEGAAAGARQGGGPVWERFSVLCGAPLSPVQIACCSSFCAFPQHGSQLCIRSLADPSLPQALQLRGHHRPISAVTFGNKQEPQIVCSASEDYVIVWDVERCCRRVQEDLMASGTVIGTLLGDVVHLSLCPMDKRVAACAGDKIYILDAKKEDVLSVLEGHLAPVTAAQFSSWEEDVLVSISEDRTFKVWDAWRGQLLHQSAVLSGSPLISLCLSEETRQLLVGSADGQVWVFSLLQGQRYRLVSRVDLLRAERRLLGRPEERDEVEVTKPVLSIAACRAIAVGDDTDGFSSSSGSVCCIGSSDGAYALNLATSELQAAVRFKDHRGLSVALAGSWAIHGACSNKVLCLVTSLFGERVALLEIGAAALAGAPSCREEQEGLCAVARAPLLQTSPLSAELVRRDGSRVLGKTDVRSCVKDQPVVFHSRVKSSGYTAPPRRTMFSPKTNTHKKNHQPSKASKRNGPLFTEYPADSPAPSVLHTHLSATAPPTAARALQYSGDGRRVLCGLADGSILLYSSTLDGAPAVYTGHDGPLRCVGWSHSNHVLLSASEDRTLRVWPAADTVPALVLGSDRFPKPIGAAQFYYMDKFLLLACGPSVQLYLYHLDAQRDDLKRLQQKSRCRLAGKLQMTSAAEITCLSAANAFFSYMVLACGSDRSVEVFDLNAGCRAAGIPDAHTRAAHHVSQNQGSVFSTQGPDAYNLFLTSAMTDAIKLWDLRTLRCARRYEGHLNRCHPCTAAFSPCGRYIASGSEDNCAYIFDIRSSSYVHKLARHSSTILNVAFNPATPQLLTASLDGGLQLFRP